MADEKIILQVDINSSKTEQSITGLTESIIGLKKAQIDLAAQVKKGEIGEVEYAKKLEKSKESISKLNSERKNEIKILKAAENSIEALEQVNAKLVKQRKVLNLGTAEGVAKYKELSAQIKINQERLNSYNADISRHQGNVGNYAGAIKNVVGKLGAIGAGIGVAIGALSELTNAFKNSSKGAELFEKISGNISGALGAMSGAFGNFVADALSGDFKKAISNFDNLGGKIRDAAKAQADLNLLLMANEKNNVAFSVSIQKAQLAVEKLQLLAEDDTRTFAERLKYTKELESATTDLFNVQLLQANENLKLANAELSLSKLKGEKLIESTKKVADAEMAISNLVAQNEIRNLSNKQKARKTELDLFEQQLDFNLDIYDRNKTNIERQLTDEKLSFEQRKKLVEELQAGTEANYKKNIELINSQLKTKLDANELEKISDEQKLLDTFYAAGAAKIVANRARGVIMENIAFRQDVADEEKRLLEQRNTELGISNAIESNYIKSITHLRKVESDKQNKILDANLAKGLKETQQVIDATNAAKDERQKTFNDIVNFADRTSDVMIDAAMQADATIQTVLAATAEALIKELETYAIAQIIKLALKASADSATLNIPGAIAAGLGIAAIKAASAGIRSQIRSSVAPAAPANVPNVSSAANLNTVNRQFGTQQQINVAAPNVNVSTSAPSASEIGNAVARAVQNVPIYVDVTQINEAQGLKAKVTQNGRI